jgi:hypothetical protein
MFEHKTEPLAPRHVFLKRFVKFFLIGSVLIILSLGIGTMGYMYFGGLDVVNAFYNSCMILTGMGPDVMNPSRSLMVFASFYAIYSGVIFLSSITIIFAPIIHRFFHIIHIEDDDKP